MTKLKSVIGKNQMTYYYVYNRTLQKHERITKASFEDILNMLENVTINTFKNKTFYQGF